MPAESNINCHEVFQRVLKVGSTKAMATFSARLPRFDQNHLVWKLSNQTKAIKVKHNPYSLC